MDLSESNGLQKRNGDQLDPQLMPQYGAPIGMVPGSTSGTTSPFPLWPGMPNLASPMAEPFNSTLLNQSSGKFPFSGMIPPTGLPNFPSEPGFIERAARLSCFGTNGGFTSLMNSPILNQTQKGELNSLSIGAGSSHGNMENNTEIPNDERNSMDENQNTTADSSHDTGGKKRKRPNQDQSMEHAQGNNEDEITKQNNSDGKKDAENNNGKSNGRNNNNNNNINNKDGSDASKDYIHVRARRGQATNSHSLAERVRREKISERMKYLQELVPGCSKVTGKAVMLDEIINYVQSLQRQVEFLSMKLAAVNPRLDLNIEALLSKDMLQGRVGCSSTVGFTPEMFHAQLSQPGLLPPGFQIPDFRRSITPQLSSINPFKDPHPPQMANPWQDELHNVMSMNFNANPPMSTQEVNAKPGDGFQI